MPWAPLTESQALRCREWLSMVGNGFGLAAGRWEAEDVERSMMAEDDGEGVEDGVGRSR